MKQRNDLKILLLQIREDEETMQEEFYNFLEFGELKHEQLTLLNVFRQPTFPPEIIDDYDALFVGGSSDVSVLKPDEYPFVNECKKLLRYCYEKNIPVFASCFGFQIVVQELGGDIIVDKPNMEMGNYKIHLTEAAKQDPLLHDVPQAFWSICGHKERAASLPEDAILLGSSELCPYHLIKFEGKPFYAFQFHPEVDKDVLAARITRYQDRYLEDAEHLQRILDSSTHDTPESNNLVKNFIDRIIMENQ